MVKCYACRVGFEASRDYIMAPIRDSVIAELVKVCPKLFDSSPTMNGFCQDMVFKSMFGAWGAYTFTNNRCFCEMLDQCEELPKDVGSGCSVFGGDGHGFAGLAGEYCHPAAPKQLYDLATGKNYRDQLCNFLDHWGVGSYCHEAVSFYEQNYETGVKQAISTAASKHNCPKGYENIQFSLAGDDNKEEDQGFMCKTCTSLFTVVRDTILMGALKGMTVNGVKVACKLIEDEGSAQRCNKWLEETVVGVFDSIGKNIDPLVVCKAINGCPKPEEPTQAPATQAPPSP
jgi:hypothetical protein